jgi:hypothetical protein
LINTDELQMFHHSHGNSPSHTTVGATDELSVGRGIDSPELTLGGEAIDSLILTTCPNVGMRSIKR